MKHAQLTEAPESYMEKLLADLQRQSESAFAELVAAQERDRPELERMLAQMAQDSQRALEQLQSDSKSQ